MNTLRHVLALGVLLPALAGAAPAELTRDAFKARLDAGTPTVIVDVRSPAEFSAGHIPGAINIPHDTLAARAGELEKHRTDGTLVLYCRSGRRTALAAEALEARGFTGLMHLVGDMQGWQAAGEPVRK